MYIIWLQVPNNRILGKELYTEEGDNIKQLGAPALPGSLIQIALPAVPLPGAIKVAKEAQLLRYHSSLWSSK